MMTKTKKFIKTSIALAAVAGFTGLGAARAEDTPVPAPEQSSAFSDLSLDAGVDWYSKYVWRGMLLTNDPVLQPSVTLGYKGFSLNVWGSYDVTDVNEDDNDEYALQELDLTLGYETTLKDIINVGVGYILYTFPGTTYDKTSEVYASVGIDCLLAPSLTVYYDFDEVKGFYANLGIGHTFELTESLGLSVSAALGWGDQNYFEGYFSDWTNPEARLADYNLSASLDYAVTDKLGISLIVAYSDFICNEVRDAIEDNGGEAGNFYGGVSVSYSF